MKYFALVALLSSCCHTRYTEAPSYPVYLFEIGDNVHLAAESALCKHSPYLCKDQGVVVDVEDLKNKCYPQLTYDVKFYNQIDSYDVCSSDLILLPAIGAF